MMLAEMADLAEAMTRPANRQQDHRHFRPCDDRLERFDRLVLSGPNPDQGLKAEGLPESLLAVPTSATADQDNGPSAEQSRNFLHFLAGFVVGRALSL